MLFYCLHTTCYIVSLVASHIRNSSIHKQTTVISLRAAEKRIRNDIARIYLKYGHNIFQNLIPKNTNVIFTRKHFHCRFSIEVSITIMSLNVSSVYLVTFCFLQAYHFLQFNCTYSANLLFHLIHTFLC